MDFETFWEVLGGFVDSFGEPFGNTAVHPKAWTFLQILWKIRRLLGVNLKRDPRAAPRSVTMRGGLPSRVWNLGLVI